MKFTTSFTNINMFYSFECLVGNTKRNFLSNPKRIREAQQVTLRQVIDSTCQVKLCNRE